MWSPVVTLSVTRGLCTHHTILIDEYDNMWGTGDNYSRQLGLTNTKYNIFTPIPFSHKVDALAMGYTETWIKILY